MSQTDRAGTNAPLRPRLDGKVLTLTLDAPPAHVLSLPMIAAIQSALDNAATDPGVNVVVLASSGPIFCAGHDLRAMRRHLDDADGGRAWYEHLFARCTAMMKTIVRSPKPVIAQVDGLATAAGCQLVASCDLAYASDRARFCTPGVNLGGFCSTPAVALSRAVGRKQAMEMLLTGDTVDAQTARDIGLVNRVLPADRLAGFVQEFAARLAARSPDAIAAGKPVFHEQADLPLDAAYATASRATIDQFFTPDTAEGMDAFLEKRAPNWPQR